MSSSNTGVNSMAQTTIILYSNSGTVDHLTDSYEIKEGVLTFTTTIGGKEKQIRTSLPFFLETDLK
jgi:hypothetical protein